MARNHEIATYDGVAMAQASETALIVYALPARVDRTRWLFDRLDEMLARDDTRICVFMVILPTADPPDAATRAENDRRLRSMFGRLRRIVTVVLGDGFRLNVVRTVMRAMFIVQRQSHLLLVASTLDDGLCQVLRDAPEQTATRDTLESVLREMCRKLDCDPTVLLPRVGAKIA
jgi:hypothetical protein